MTYYGVINAIPNEYKKSFKEINAQQEQPTQQSQNLKVLTTKAIHKSFVDHIIIWETYSHTMPYWQWVTARPHEPLL